MQRNRESSPGPFFVMPGPDRASPARHSASFLRAARFLSPEAMDAVEGLIDDLDLEFFVAEKVEEPPATATSG